jgi:hypothetical protein
MMKMVIIAGMITALVRFGSAVGVGDSAPDFTLQKAGGGSETLSTYNGKIVYIFWFGYD